MCSMMESAFLRTFKDFKDYLYKLKITTHSHMTYQDDSTTISARVYAPDDG